MDAAALPRESLEAFLDRLASDRPAPGGGAAAALTGAAAAALVAMVCRVTQRHVPSDEVIASASERADALRVRLFGLIRDDIEAYQSLLEARRIAGGERAAHEQAALQRATAVPIEIARAAAAVLELCTVVVDFVRLTTVGDLAVAAALAGAVIEASALTAQINLKDIAERRFIQKAAQELDVVRHSADKRQTITRRVTARTGLEKLV
jgi:formiminotetrahydrofolate cyclodeaminase